MAAVVVVAWGGIAFAATIHDATKSGDTAKVKRLIAGHPGLVKKGEVNGDTSMHFAPFYGHKDVVEALLASMIGTTGSPLSAFL